jgi:salicylate hydroxylase
MDQQWLQMLSLVSVTPCRIAVSTLTNGKTVADGIHSRLRAIITGDESHVAKKTGLTCYRVAVSTETAKEALGDGPLPQWWTNQNRSSLISSADGTARVVTAYPLRHHTFFNLSCIIRTEESTKKTTESWDVDGDSAKMLEAFGDFHESLRLILR